MRVTLSQGPRRSIYGRAESPRKAERARDITGYEPSTRPHSSRYSRLQVPTRTVDLLSSTTLGRIRTLDHTHPTPNSTEFPQSSSRSLGHPRVTSIILTSTLAVKPTRQPMSPQNKLAHQNTRNSGTWGVRAHCAQKGNFVNRGLAC